MSPLLAVYLLVNLLCSIDSLVKRKAEVGPLWFSPLLVQNVLAAVQGVCGCARNIMFSSVQRTSHLFVCCRVELSGARKQSCGVFPLMVAPVESRPLEAVSPVNSLGMVRGGRAATNSCMCARTTTPLPPYRSRSIGCSIERGCVTPSSTLLFTGKCLCCACASTPLSCTHHITNTTNSVGRHFSVML
jgi:hypothetical protein